jgi:hypothetical protein
MELDRSLLQDSVFEKFMKRPKTLISKLEEFVSDVPENYQALDFDDFAVKFNTDSVQILWDDDDFDGGETIKPLINTQPERTLGKVEPCSRRFGGDTSDEASESEHTSKYNSLIESASSETLSAEEPAAPSRPAVLSALDENSLVSNISFIVSPPPKWQAMVQQLTFIYKSGTNAVERFCYKQYIEGGKKAKLRKRYITKDKFISYAIAIINSCWFSKNNCQTIKYMKLIFKGLNTNVKWDNHDFYYVLNILLLIGIINKVTNSYKVGSHGKQYEFVRGSLSRFCSEGIYFEFPVL